MKAKTRIYAVKEVATGKYSLVRSYSPSQSRSFISQTAFTVEVASQDMIFEHAKKGGEILDASAPENKDAFEDEA